MGQNKKKKNSRQHSRIHKNRRSGQDSSDRHAAEGQVGGADASHKLNARDPAEREQRILPDTGDNRREPSSRTNNQKRRNRQSISHHRDANHVHDHAPTYVYLVKNYKTSETYICGSDERLDPGTFVVAPTRYGLDMAQVLGYIRSRMLSSTVKELEAARTRTPFIDMDIPCIECPGCSGEEERETVVSSAEDGPVSDEGKDSTSLSEEAIIALEREALFAEALEQERLKREEELKHIDWIDHVANDFDIVQYEENKEKALEALRICKEKVAQHKLDMKLVDAHYMLCEPKVIFFFTADNRVDFRQLVKDLVSVFRMRIELRQIGVRDESRILGGIAVCGRDYCCHGVTDRLNPVSIKMAKEQNLSLNSMKISGPCGRLLCCLSYEYDFYKEEKSKLPSTGSRLKIRNELLKITEVNILSRKYHLTAVDGRMLIIPFDKVVYNHETGRWDVDNKYIEEVLSV